MITSGIVPMACMHATFATCIIFAILMFLTIESFDMGKRGLGIFFVTIAGLIAGVVIGITVHACALLCFLHCRCGLWEEKRTRRARKNIIKNAISKIAINRLTEEAYAVIQIEVIDQSKNL